MISTTGPLPLTGLVRSDWLTGYTDIKRIRLVDGPLMVLVVEIKSESLYYLSYCDPVFNNSSSPIVLWTFMYF